jgi:hypothetical protein
LCPQPDEESRKELGGTEGATLRRIGGWRRIAALLGHHARLLRRMLGRPVRKLAA